MKTVAEGLYRPNGLAIHKGTLYIAELSQISKIDDIEDKLDNPPKPTVIYTDLPKDEPHGWKFIGIGPDDKLYVPVGAARQQRAWPPDRHGQIRRIDLDGKDAEVDRARRAQHGRLRLAPDVSKQLYFSDNGRDWLSEDRAGRRAQSHHPGRPALRLRRIATSATSPIRNSAGARTATDSRAAGRPDRPAFGRPRPALLHRQRCSRRSTRTRSSSRVAARGIARVKFGGDVVAIFLNKDGTVKNDRAVHHRLHREQQLSRPSGRRGARWRMARCWCRTTSTARSTASATARPGWPAARDNDARPGRTRPGRFLLSEE